MSASTITNALGQTLDVTEAARVATKVGAWDRCCWWNAVKAMRRCYRNRPDACYVEGHAISKFGLVVAHGWVELGDAIVDPTPCWLEDGDERPVYFPGIRYTHADMKRRRTDTMPWAEYGSGRYRINAAFLASYIAAERWRMRDAPPEFTEAWIGAAEQALKNLRKDKVTA